MNDKVTDPHGALRAIVARLDGEYSHPDLLAVGPLAPDANADIRHIASMALKGPMTQSELARKQQKAEPLTIAYVAMGAQQAIERMPGGVLPSRICDRYGGQLGFIDAVIAEAWRLDAEAYAREERDEGLSGVFVYEIAEPFGERFAQALLDDDLAKPEPIVTALFAEMDEQYQVSGARP